MGMAATASALQVADDRLRLEMVERIFRHFDADGDGGLDRREMAALVVALNPRIKFTGEQTDGVVDRVFQFYSKAARVTLGALLCIYDDIAGTGDVHRDFDALFLGHASPHSTAASSKKGPDGGRTTHQQVEEEEEEEEEESDAAHLSSIVDRLSSADPSLASSSVGSEEESSEFDDDGCAPPLEASPSFRWLLSRSPAPPSGPGHALERDVAYVSSPTVVDRLPSMDSSSLASSVVLSEDESSESDYARHAPPLGSEELPSLRWMLAPSDDPPRRGPSGVPSLASSSLSSDVESSDVDRGRYPPQSEWEEIPSPRWLPSPPSAPDRTGAGRRAKAEEVRNHKRGRGGATAWAGIRKLGTFYRLRNLRRKN